MPAAHRLRMITFSILIISSLSGCYDSEDIDRRMISSPIGVDSAPGGRMMVTIRMPLVRPAGETGTNQGKNENFILRVALTDGIIPAIRDFQHRDEHSIFVGQCRAILFGESLARQGLIPVLDFFDRTPQFPPTALIVIARPSAGDIQKINWPEREMRDQNIRWFFSNRGNQKYGVEKWTLYQNIYDPLQDPVVPIVTPSDEYTTIKMVGMAVFHEDRMVGELNEAETVLFGLLKHPGNNNRVTLPSGYEPHCTVQLVSGGKSVKVARIANRYRFTIRLNLKGFLAEMGGYPSPLTKQSVSRLEKAVSRYLEHSLLKLLDKLRRLECDPLDLGNNARIQHANIFSFKRWPLDYRNAQFEVHTKFHTERIGVIH